MKKKSYLKKITLGLLVFLLVIQFFPINKKNPPADPKKDLLVLSHPSDSIAFILKTACYDCHSNETVYPWYTNVAPVSWWIRHHIDEGREHLNFSTWGDYPGKKIDHKLKNCIEIVEEEEMPMTSYTWMHQPAALSASQKTQLIDWFKELRGH